MTAVQSRANHGLQANAAASGLEKQNIWADLLKSASTTTTVPTSNLVILGGTAAHHTALLNSLAPPPPPQTSYQSRRRHAQRAPPRPVPSTSSSIGLGYTYRDLYTLPATTGSNASQSIPQSTSADDDDLQARLSVHILHDPDPVFTPLLHPCFSTSTSLDSTAAVIILDWAKPWTFLSTLEAAIRTLRGSLTTVRDSSRDIDLALENNDRRWLDWRNRPFPSGSAGTQSDLASTATLPLGPGEFDTPLGIPLLILGMDAHKMEEHEKQLGWKEEDFDFILQFVRTIALKSGAGLVYTLPGGDGSGATPPETKLLRGMLGIEGSGWDTVRHNVVDRDGTIVPPGWDSWGKIRVLREGFDVEGISAAWTQDLDMATVATAARAQEDNTAYSTTARGMYETRIADPRPPSIKTAEIEVELIPDQVFLTQQLERLEALKAEEERARLAEEKRRAEAGDGGTPGRPGYSARSATGTAAMAHEGMATGMKEQIGPVQFNVGGIQYDADEALRRLKERNKPTPQSTTGARPSAARTTSTPERRARTSRESTPYTPGSPPQFEAGARDIPVENLEAYFASLMKGRGGAGGGSVAGSPRWTNSPRTGAGASAAAGQGQEKGSAARGEGVAGGEEEGE